jgi:circadian clock protein KaiC
MTSGAEIGKDRAATGLPGLDEILRGGFPRNRLYLVHGNPGTGKTTLALQFLIEGARRHEPVLYVTLSETRDELIDVAKSHNLSLEGITIHDLALPPDHIRSDSEYTLFHPSEIELGETTKAIFAEVERVRPSRVVFDSLSEMRLLAGEALRYRRQILALKHFFVGRECTVLLLDDNTSPDSDRQLESLAHGVLLLEQQFPKYGGPRRQLRILKLRGVNFEGGYHDFSVQTGGIEVFPRLISADHPASFPQEVLSSGIPELDDLTGGGLDAGTAVLVMGPAGTGKSTIAAQYAAHAARQGKKVAYFTLDESRATLLKRTRDLGMEFEKHIVSGLCTVRQVDPAEMSPGEFSVLVRRSVEHDNAKIVVIDSLNGYQQAMPGEDFLALHMHELLGYLRLQGTLTFLVMSQAGMLGPSMTSPVDISYLADSVLLLRYFEAGGQIRKAISVVKKRTGGHEDTIREFALGDGGLRVGAPLRQFRGVLSGIPTFTGGVEQVFRASENG